jgi:hypothetical protein
MFANLMAGDMKEETLMREVSTVVLVSLALSGFSAFAQEPKIGNAASTLSTVGAQMTADAPARTLATPAVGPSSISMLDQFNANTTGQSTGLAAPGQTTLGTVTAPPAMPESASIATATSAASASLANVANIASAEPRAISSMAGIDSASEARNHMSGLTSGLTAPALRR